MQPRIDDEIVSESFFDTALSWLQQVFGHSAHDADQLIREYLSVIKSRPNTAVRLEWLEHDGSNDFALRAHYDLVLQGDPSRYIEWRKDQFALEKLGGRYIQK